MCHLSTRLGDPNKARAPNTLVNVGVLYESRGGERMQQLAERFFTSVARLLKDNPDFVDRSGGYDKAVGRALVPGYNLCILPPLCQVMTSRRANGLGLFHACMHQSTKGFIGPGARSMRPCWCAHG
jgi:hypothetical protein